MKDDIASEYASHFRSLGNATTAFIVIQGFAFMTSIASRDRWICELIEKDIGIIIAFAWMVIFGTLAAIACRYFSYKEQLLVLLCTGKDEGISKLGIMPIAKFRISIIIFMTLLQIFTFASPFYDSELPSECRILYEHTFRIKTHSYY